ncbi:YlqD family protein [Bacillus benzoevorans]|uniref:Glycerol-3-phosphate dehydrogenase n=1 Tax=Bacillus benzoevorans TaxID=1456 RepID=A0A7X0LV13_9BACI|nr:YlqD family protein [Bacillus benzoevorans]MBB6443819.1 glycerol-3-phosphate dehydrogenase [Bacillus benzoevorans]
MKLLQSVVVKQVLTEKSKGELQDKYHTNRLQLQKESEQLRFELKKLEKEKRFQQQSLKRQFEQEIQRRQEKIKLIDFQLEQLHMLPLGSELKEKEVQAIVDVEIGASWSDITKGRTIVIKDDIVQEIR